jgi:hypothetical protein
MNRRFVGPLSCVFVTSVVAACGGGTPAPAADAGLDPSSDAGLDAGLVIAAPAPPLPPVLTPCPAGWREVADASGLITCDPWPATGYRTDCAWDEAHFAGTPGCARIGTECPADGWPADLPTDRVVVYVDDDAAAGGDGASRASAFASIGAATAMAPAGAVIAVATGRYDEAVSVGAGITLWGACVSGTRILARLLAEGNAALELAADGAGARNLGIDAPEGAGIAANGVNAVTIDAVVVSGAMAFGLYLRDATMSASDVVVRGTRGSSSTGEFGRGVDLEPGAHLALSLALIEDNHEAGVLGIGVGVATSMQASDVVVRGTRGRQSDGWGGRGISAQEGAHFVLARVILEDNRQLGISAMGAGAAVEANDVVVRGTREDVSTGMFGRGVDIESGARVSLSRVLLDDNREDGVFVDGAGASADASDVVVRGTRERTSDGTRGRGIVAAAAALLVLARVLVDDNRTMGLFADGRNTTVEGNDLIVRGTRGRALDGADGFGAKFQAGAHVVLSRARFEDQREAGVFSTGAGTSLDASDLVVSDTTPRASDSAVGAGLWTELQARTVVARVRIVRSHWIGMGSAGASVEAQDLVVSGVEASRCLPGACAYESGGFGLVAIFGGALVATRFAVEDATLCGLLIGRDSAAATALDLTSGVIDRSMVGACVQQDGYDTTRLQSGVEYRDVGVPLRATSYELPANL